MRTTLLEELEQAAEAEGALGNWNRAARLRARVERIRELLDLAHKQKFNGGRRELARALTGPLDTSPEAPRTASACFPWFPGEVSKDGLRWVPLTPEMDTRGFNYWRTGPDVTS